MMKTSELIGPALDWATAKCEGRDMYFDEDGEGPWFRDSDTHRDGFHTDYGSWAQCGPIIDREKIELRRGNPLYFPQGNEHGDYYEPLWIAGKQHGTTPLVAAMRCYVASQLGDEIEIPEELR